MEDPDRRRQCDSPPTTIDPDGIDLSQYSYGEREVQLPNVGQFPASCPTESKVPAADPRVSLGRCRLSWIGGCFSVITYLIFKL